MKRIEVIIAKTDSVRIVVEAPNEESAFAWAQENAEKYIDLGDCSSSVSWCPGSWEVKRTREIPMEEADKEVVVVSLDDDNEECDG
jgi:hypothetical protein